MAKKRQKITRFSIQGYDLNHYRTTEQYAAAVQALFDRATLAIAQSTSGRTIDPDKPFSFDDYPEVKAELKRVVGQLASQLTTTIESGSKNQWLFACEKNDGFLESIMDTSKLSKARLKKMQDRNLDALKTFQGRKVSGLDLSQRVWRYVGQYRDQLEAALDVGLGEGRSAQQLARDVKKNLREPDRLFRRVRDKRGNLVLSKAARAFHPGQGVYRSSVKNAQRLTRSEINMAYRESDFLRWQQLDFVVGFEIHRSNHEPLCKCKMCDRLQGRYPKTFKFKGWHPQCMCYAVPILMDEETFDENELGDLKAALRGTEYKKKQSRNLVTDVPDGFKEWVAENIEASAGWASTPYFIRDNFVDGDLSKGLKIALPTVEPDAPDVPKIPLFEAKTPQEAIDFILANIAESCSLQIKPKDLPLVNRIINQVNQRMQAFGLPKFNNFGKPASSKAEASWDGHDNSLNVNLSRLSGSTVWTNAQKWITKKGVKWTHFVDEADVVRQTIDHEIGHCLMSKFHFKSEVIDAFRKASKSVMKNGKPFNEVDEVLGYYASTCEDEYFAEAFAMFMSADRDKLGEVTAEMMQKFVDVVKHKIGRDPFAVPGKEAPKPDPVQAQLEALMPQIEAARKVADEWGLELRLKGLDKAVAARDVKDINKFISLITSEGTKYTTELSAFFKYAAQVIKDINAAGVGVLPDVVAELTQYMTNLSADKSMWADGGGAFYKSELEKSKEKLRQYKVSPEAALSEREKRLLSETRTAIKEAGEWGIRTANAQSAVDAFIKNPSEDNYWHLWDMQCDLEKKIRNATRQVDKFIADADALMKEAQKFTIDCADLRKFVSYLQGSDRAYSWSNFKRDINKAFNDLKAKVDEAQKAEREKQAAAQKDVLNPTFTGKPHPALKTSYSTDSEVDATFTAINKDFTTEKWFEHGDLRLSPTRKSGVNGFTYMNGKISLTPDRLKRVKSALGKIGQGKSDEITFEEADAMATFWHEICHNRNIPSWTQGDKTKMQTRFMELANEFVARHTLPEFYAKLGASSVPHPEFQTNRESTGYNKMVTNYDFVIKETGLDHAKVLASVRKHLFTGGYNDQQTGLAQALLDGGLTYADGTAVKKSDLNALLKLIRTLESGRMEYDPKTFRYVVTMSREGVILEWLKEHKFIK